MRLFKSIMLACFFSLIALFAQAEKRTMNVASSYFFISGTTNIGGWDCQQSHAEGIMDITVHEDGGVVHSLEVKVPVKEFTDCTPPAGPSSGQEKAVHKHLKAEDHPYVTFVLERTHPETVEDRAIFYGELTVAGVTQTIRSGVNIERSGNNLTITGNQDLKMTDYEIDPPTGLLGTIRAREEVEVEFEISFELEQKN